MRLMYIMGFRVSMASRASIPNTVPNKLYFHLKFRAPERIAALYTYLVSTLYGVIISTLYGL